MDFEIEIYELLSGDTGITSTVTGGIHTHNLPENFNYRTPSLVLQYKTDEVVDTLGEEDVLEMYTLYIIIVSTSTETNKNIARQVRTFFNSINTTNMRDVRYIDDINSVDFERGYYTKSLQFKVTYEP